MRKGELSERPKSLSVGSRVFVGEKERSGTKQLFRWGKLAPSMAVLPRASQLARREPSPCGLTKVQENIAVGETAQMSYDFIRLLVCHLKRHAFVLCRRVLGREFCG